MIVEGLTFGGAIEIVCFLVVILLCLAFLHDDNHRRRW